MALLRVKLAVKDAAKWLTPREFLLALREAVEEADLPVARSGGQGSRLRITPGPPRRPGYCSRCEYVDFKLCEPITGVEFGRRLASALPEAIEVIWLKRMPSHCPSIKAAVRNFTYTIECSVDPKQVAAFEKATTWPLTQIRKRGERILDLKESVSLLEVLPGKVVMRIEARPEGMPKPEEVLEAVFDVSPEQAAQLPTERTDMKLAPFTSGRVFAMEHL